MPVGSASSQRFRDGGDLTTESDTTKKKVIKPTEPVDTVRLKKDLKSDASNVMDYASEGNFMGGGYGKAVKSMNSRSDSLEDARKGKIPVKKP